jgi:hypothetical protein
VRRLRLGHELETRVKAAKLSHDQLARQLGWSRSKVTRMVNGDSAREGDVLDMLRVLGVKGEDGVLLRNIARDAAHQGWWVSNAKAMGLRQAQAADLESGAATIREYSMTYVPGLVQTVAYMESVAATDDLTSPAGDNGTAGLVPEKMVAGRLNRQEALAAPDGPQYEAIVDELVLRRPTAPLEILAEQFRFMAELSHVTLRILPTGAELEAHTVPKAGFWLYTYRDPDDGTIASVDTLTQETVVTAPGDVHRLELLYGRIRSAALPAHESADLLRQAADNMMERITS